MGPQSIRDYIASLGPRYRAASKTAKSGMLDEFCALTGRHRKSAVRRLARPPRPRHGAGGRPPRYGPEVTAVLTQIWEASDYLCGKRLAPFLEPLLDALERHHALHVPPPLRALLLTISPATIDRRLQGQRRAHPRGLSTTGPSPAAFAAQVPVRTFAEWDGVRPGALQADLVAHCGDSAAGFFLSTLVAVDVATGWTECRAVLGKHYYRIRDAVQWVEKDLPMPLLSFHTDNGGEFLNHLLLPWCRNAGIAMSRGRPHRKNDQAYAEQKNWAIVRRLVGYDRYSSRPAYEELRAFYRVLRLYWNFFQPLRKLVAKVRHGARVTKRYDRAQTPYQRLLASGILRDAQRQALARQYQDLNPLALRTDLQERLRRLWTLADRPADGKTKTGLRAVSR
jgi:transposase InsO family protein